MGDLTEAKKIRPCVPRIPIKVETPPLPCSCGAADAGLPLPPYVPIAASATTTSLCGSSSEMAGLSFLLETQKTFPKHTHIISKTSFLKNSTFSFSSSTSASARRSTFLEHCCLCRGKLRQGQDIYMYRGDRAFCSEECRCRQIFMDEESGTRDCCSLAAAAAERRRGRAAACRWFR
ncbi:hypothetical protein MUK42_05009 [Musa troglodytarum]|uniref:FLZ-type domain-containing protein n=1 Tax=Musa troglodytarum TaxID=320322 RepID=A0A9E7EU39_9LILI|nr:hypothetical protein MUK42_05009 [Musa troglodytarum]